MNQENQFPSNDLNHEKYLSKISRKKFYQLENSKEDKSSITPKRPLLSRDRILSTFGDISPLSDHNSRFQQPKHVFLPPTPVESIENDQSSISIAESYMFTINLPQSTVIDDNENTNIPIYIQKKARPAPPTTWKAPFTFLKSSTMSKTSIESSSPVPELSPTPPITCFQPAIRARIPFNLSSTNTIDKQTHVYTIWLNSLFSPVDFMSNTTENQSLAESNRWCAVRARAREVFTRDIQSIATKITADTNIDHCRINPIADLNFSVGTNNRQALLNFISSYNRIWFRLAMEVLFPINIENYHQMKLALDQYLIQSTGSTSSTNETNLKKSNLYNNNKTASIQSRLTIKNLILIIIFLERAKSLRLIDNDPCLYNRDSKFKSTKESIDILSRDFISTDTNLLRRLKLAGYEPTYRQTSLDEFHYLISNNENKLFEDLKGGIRLTRCAQILLSSTNEHVAKFDLSTKLKCPVVNLVHKLLNIDQAFELLQTYGHVDLTGISNKDIMNGNKQRTLELLWRIFMVCYLPKHLSPIEKLNNEISILTQNLSKFSCSSIEQQLITTDITILQKQQIHFTPTIHSLIKWVQLICAHYKFWLYDLQESFADGRAFLYIISYYLPSLCDFTRDINHLTTLATCQTRDEHIQFNLELGQQHATNLYERNVKSNFRLLEEYVKQFGTFSYDLIKYESYAKDVPDERCTIIILAMLAHDLLFLNDNNNNPKIDLRRQPIFQKLKEKYSNHEEPMIEIKKEEITNNTLLNQQEGNSTEISILTDTPVEEIITLKLSITYPTEDLPFIQSEPPPLSEGEEEEDNRTKIINLSQAVLDTMNYDILDRLELLSEDDDDDDDSFNSARSSSTTRIDHRRSSISATMAAISLDDFIELEKTIEKEESKNNPNITSLSLIDVTMLSEVDSIESNKLDEVCFTDPVNTRIIKETFTLFLCHQQRTLENEEPTEKIRNEQQSDVDREIHAVEVVQAHWRGYQIRADNQRNDHPVVAILEKLRLRNSLDNSSLTLRERMMQIVQEFSESSVSSLTAYLHFLCDVEPIIACCLEIRYLICQQGLLRLFFILLRCSNRSEPSTILLSQILNILQLFTVKHDLVMKLIDKPEQIKDFLMLLLKYYQNNGCELFEQICFLLQAIVNDTEARIILRSNKSFNETIQYIYKRMFNKIPIDNEKYRQQVRSTPKQSTKSKRRQTTSLNQSSILYPTPKMMRPSMVTQNENILKRNLISIEQFMKIFYRD